VGGGLHFLALHAGMIFLLSGVLAVAYAVGQQKLSGRRGVRDWRGISLFSAGLVALLAAFSPPLEEAADRLFSIHMVQHELLMVVAAPLLVASASFPALIWALPRRGRLVVARVMRRAHIRALWSRLTGSLPASVLHGLAIWLWHAPLLFDAALEHEWIHVAQHLSFFGTGLLFWSSVIRPHRREARGQAVLSLFATSVHSGVLGALLTFSRAPWYSPYGAASIEDQQLAGLIMWIPASVAYLVASLIVARRWLIESEMVVKLQR
jgi:putative membrane protein